MQSNIAKQAVLSLRFARAHSQNTMLKSGFGLLFLAGFSIFLCLLPTGAKPVDLFMLLLMFVPALLALVYIKNVQSLHQMHEVPHPMQLPISQSQRFVGLQFSLAIYWLASLLVIAISIVLGSLLGALLYRTPFQEVFTWQGTYVLNAYMSPDMGLANFLRALLMLFLSGHILVNYACFIGSLLRRYAILTAIMIIFLTLWIFILVGRSISSETITALFQQSWLVNHTWFWLLLGLFAMDTVFIVLNFFSLKRLQIY